VPWALKVYRRLFTPRINIIGKFIDLNQEFWNWIKNSIPTSQLYANKINLVGRNNIFYLNKYNQTFKLQLNNWLQVKYLRRV